ncbi:Carbonic anhydrase or acetyltransferase, isoleucine patch superfamily [Nocardioides exalbidus]|uniref:Carbonic anhydrase or acetyltransferase, isoleucine patch superfamily n=1 Tax=Nocardioides exalbidus TaxID=402596 RepID=A0A1H4LLE7_9ACTN|nr:gamma carbonic anhydrase family protein [Nocardioides exalbidus]SEB71560.1 Carbonic anhydrase or acetyltransferase, isoleucine patch superfamily [Nocardioides exalbidus]
MATLLPFGDHTPEVDPTAWLAPNATLIGDVTVGEDASVWFGAVIRGDGAHISVGARSNVQDNAVFHADPGFALTLGADVAVGHAAVLHGCTVDDGVLVGMGAVVMNGAHIGSGSIVAAGALVTEGTVVPPRSLVAGVPAKVRRETTEDEVAGIARNTSGYRERARAYAQHG